MENLKNNEVVNSKRGQETETKSDSLPFGHSEVITVMRTEETGTRSLWQCMEWLGRDNV